MVHSGCKLVFVLRGLVLLPIRLTESLLFSKALVIVLHFFELGLFARCILVFKYTSHPSDGMGLLRILLILVLKGLLVVIQFLFLSFDPVFLLVSLLGMQYGRDKANPHPRIVNSQNSKRGYLGRGDRTVSEFS